MSKNPHYCAGLMALSFALLPLAMLVSRPAGADELMKWERIPLQIPLKVGQERVVFVDKNVRVGFPPALNGKLRVQSTGGAVYLKADSAFPQTRVQLQDVESGEVLLFDIAAGEKGPTEPVRLVYSGDVSTLSHAGDAAGQPGGADRAASGSGSSAPTGSDDGTQAKRKKIRYSAPIPVLLTRYAAQSLYAPARTVEAVPGIHPVNPHLPRRVSTLYPSEPLTVTPLAGWGVANRSVVALRLTNTGTGMSEPNAAAQPKAIDTAGQRIEALDREIAALKNEMEMKRELSRNSVLTIIDRENQRVETNPQTQSDDNTDSRFNQMAAPQSAE